MKKIIITIQILMVALLGTAQTITLDNLDRITTTTYSDGTIITYTYDATGNRTGRTVVRPGVEMNAKVFLQGAYDETTGLMKDLLREQNIIPNSEPYTGQGYVHSTGGGNETIPSILLQQEGSKAIVDWVIVELRNSTDPSIIEGSRSALLRRDGSIVDKDGSAALRFKSVLAGDYFVAIKHRNHLPVRTAAPITLESKTTSILDFSVSSTAVHGTDARRDMSGVLVLWGGDVNGDQVVRATPQILPPPSIASDVTDVLDNTLLGNPNGTVAGYENSDVNMDGKVRMTPVVLPPPGTPSDATFILDGVLDGNPNSSKSTSID